MQQCDIFQSLEKAHDKESDKKMLIYFLLIGLILLPGLVTGRIFRFDRHCSADAIPGDFENKHFRRNYTIYCAILIFIVSAFRDFSVGTDTQSYINKFTGELGTIPLGPYLSSLVPTSVGKFVGVVQSEAGFTLYNIILNDLGVSQRVFLAITSAFCTYVFARFIYLFSRNVGLSFFVHITFGAFSLSLSGIRQFIAICFVLLAFEQIKKKSFLKYVIFIALAVSFHYSAIITVPLYLLNVLRENKRVRRSTLVAVPVAILSIWLIFIEETSALMSTYASGKYILIGYLEDTTNQTNILVYIFAICLFLVCMFFLVSQREKKSNDDLQWVILAALYVVTTLMSSVVFMAGRLTYYFLVFYVAFLPNCFYKAPKHIRVMATICVFIVGITYFAITVPGSSMGTDVYRFGW